MTFSIALSHGKPIDSQPKYYSTHTPLSIRDSLIEMLRWPHLFCSLTCKSVTFIFTYAGSFANISASRHRPGADPRKSSVGSNERDNRVRVRGDGTAGTLLSLLEHKGAEGR